MSENNKLSPRQARFVEEYLIDLNATQAAIRAGYSERTANQQGARLLANVNIKAAVQAAKENRTERTEVTQDWVVEQIKQQFEVANQRVKKIDMLGDPVLDDQGREVSMPVDQASALKALDMLAKHTGAYEADNRRQLEGGIEITWLDDDDEDEGADE